jgi:hypothetical protein
MRFTERTHLSDFLTLFLCLQDVACTTASVRHNRNKMMILQAVRQRCALGTLRVMSQDRP